MLVISSELYSTSLLQVGTAAQVTEAVVRVRLEISLAVVVNVLGLSAACPKIVRLVVDASPSVALNCTYALVIQESLGMVTLRKRVPIHCRLPSSILARLRFIAPVVKVWSASSAL